MYKKKRKTLTSVLFFFFFFFGLVTVGVTSLITVGTESAATINTIMPNYISGQGDLIRVWIEGLQIANCKTYLEIVNQLHLFDRTVRLS